MRSLCVCTVNIPPSCSCLQLHTEDQTLFSAKYPDLLVRGAPMRIKALTSAVSAPCPVHRLPLCLAWLYRAPHGQNVNEESSATYCSPAYRPTFVSQLAVLFNPPADTGVSALCRVLSVWCLEPSLCSAGETFLPLCVTQCDLRCSADVSLHHSYLLTRSPLQFWCNTRHRRQP